VARLEEQKVFFRFKDILTDRLEALKTADILKSSGSSQLDELIVSFSEDLCALSA